MEHKNVIRRENINRKHGRIWVKGALHAGDSADRSRVVGFESAKAQFIQNMTGLATPANAKVDPTILGIAPK